MPENSAIPALIVADDPDILDDSVDEQLLDDEDSAEESLRYEISSYGADYDVDGLVKRLRSGDCKIPAFQRGYVWPIKQASRFIESLLLGLPVPGIFLSKEADTNKLLVIDGHQRLTTLRSFYDGIFPSTKKEFGLSDVEEGFIGKTYKTLEEEDRRSLDNAIIHATIVNQTNPKDGGSAIYKIFERLNSSGMLLSPQEIRTAIYGGRLSTLLSDLNKNEKWRVLFGPVNKRMRDQELILRFLALIQNEETYTRPMKGFLNKFMETERNLTGGLSAKLTTTFSQAIDAVHDGLGPKAFKRANSFNAALFDSVLIGVSHRIELKNAISQPEFVRAYNELIENKSFQQWISSATSDDETLKKRLAEAKAAFAGVP